MDWLNKQISTLLNSFVETEIGEIEIEGTEDEGYLLEYGNESTEFDSGRELIGFYNRHLRDELDRNPVSVIGDAQDQNKMYVHESGASAIIHKNGNWAVDVFNTAKNYVETAGRKTREEFTVQTYIDEDESEEEIARGLNEYAEELTRLGQRDPMDTFNQHLTYAISGTITQAIIESEAETYGETSIDYLIDEIEELDRQP